jgi:RTX calcium-binding nonapeptide repeat (4 copies)
MRATVTLAAVLVVLVTAPARAEDLNSTNGFVDYADTGEPSANNLTVSVDGADYRFVDGALIAASGACSASGVFSARCPAAGVVNMKVELGGEDDRLDATGIDVPVAVVAGAGSDQAVGGTGADGLAGNLGDDEMHGGPGPDSLGDAAAGQQGGGADDFYGDSGDDMFSGAGPSGTGAGADLSRQRDACHDHGGRRELLPDDVHCLVLSLGGDRW